MSITPLRIVSAIGAGTLASTRPIARQAVSGFQLVVDLTTVPSPYSHKDRDPSGGADDRCAECSQVAVAILECVSPLGEVFEADRGASSDGRQRVLGHSDRYPEMFAHQPIESSEQ